MEQRSLSAGCQLHFYINGAVLQFVLIAIIRFAYRCIIVEHKKIANRNQLAVNVMIIGAGEIGYRAIKQLEDNSTYRRVCVIDNKSTTDGMTFDSIPVLSELKFDEAIAKFGVKAVFIADLTLTVDSRNNIKRVCEDKNVEFQDYTDYLSNLTSHISLTALLAVTKCPVLINNSDEIKEYSTGDGAIESLNGPIYSQHL